MIRRGGLVTFSGLDGAGKTSLIAALKARLEWNGHAVVVLTMYDDLMFFSYVRRLRDAAGRGSGRDTATAGPPPEPAMGWQQRLTRLVFVRQCLQPLDLIIARAVLAYHRRLRRRTVIADRFFFDSLVDIAGVSNGRWFYDAEAARQIMPSRKAYIRRFLRLVPKPDLAIFVDVQPDIAYGRKPEYPRDYFEGRHVAYHWMFGTLLPNAVAFNNDDFTGATGRLLALVEHRRRAEPRDAA